MAVMKSQVFSDLGVPGECTPMRAFDPMDAFFDQPNLPDVIRPQVHLLPFVLRSKRIGLNLTSVLSELAAPFGEHWLDGGCGRTRARRELVADRIGIPMAGHRLLGKR
jgi:hypothetical protein